MDNLTASHAGEESLLHPGGGVRLRGGGNAHTFRLPVQNNRPKGLHPRALTRSRMGRTSNKQNKFAGGGGGGGGGGADEEQGMRHSAEFEQAQIDLLVKQCSQQRMTWEEYKEKHKSQLEDRMGAGLESDSREYRKMLDAERNAKLARGHNHKALANELDKDKEKKRLKKEKKKAKKEKKKAKKKEKKAKKTSEGKEKKRKRESDSSGSSSSSSSDSEEEGRKSKKSKKSEKDREKSPEGFGVRLSDFHAGVHDDSD